MALTPGLLLSDRYRLTRRLAIGGMGEVWEADDTRLARSVAVKVLKSELTSDPEFVDRFRSEARITASLNTSGIAAVYDYGEVASIAGGPRDTAFLVMELVIGEPLSAVLVRTPRISVPRTLDLLEQAGRALQVAHVRALVHRDIKPGNILITPTGEVKITDFGIAKVAYQVPVTRGGLVMGTAQYLAPEQASGREAIPASDIYALGVVAYECLAGVRPFNGENPVGVAMMQVHDAPPPLPPDIPPHVVALVMRMLAKDPAARFPDGASLAAAVAAVRGGAAPSRVRGTVVPSVPAPSPVPAAMAHSPLGPGVSAPMGTGQPPLPPLGAGYPSMPMGATSVGAMPMGAMPLGAMPLGATPTGVPTGQTRVPSRSRRGWIVLLILALLVVAGVVIFLVVRSHNSSAPATRPVVTAGHSGNSHTSDATWALVETSSSVRSSPRVLVDIDQQLELCLIGGTMARGDGRISVPDRWSA